MTTPVPPKDDPLISVRAALVVLLALLVGAAAGALTFLSGHDVAVAILAGGAAVGGALKLFNGLIR